jgi:hypothetical protein
MLGCIIEPTMHRSSVLTYEAPRVATHASTCRNVTSFCFHVEGRSRGKQLPCEWRRSTKTIGSSLIMLMVGNINQIDQKTGYAAELSSFSFFPHLVFSVSFIGSNSDLCATSGLLDRARTLLRRHSLAQPPRVSPRMRIVVREDW